MGSDEFVIHYSYDAVGNRLMKTEGDQITRYQWDLNGNLLQKATPQGTIDYRWDSRNRLIAIEDHIAKSKLTYRYDAAGMRRIGKTLEQKGERIETEYLVDSRRPYSEIVIERTRINGGAWQETAYLHTPDGVGELLAQSVNGETKHLYQDGQGSTRFVTDNAQKFELTYSYDAFGNEITELGKTHLGEASIQHGYVGEYYDNSAGFYHLRARDYDSKIGRFISRDSFEGYKSDPYSLNKYSYAHNDPINNIDPSGKSNYIEQGTVAAIISEIALWGASYYMALNMIDGMLGTTLVYPIADDLRELFERTMRGIKKVISPVIVATTIRLGGINVYNSDEKSDENRPKKKPKSNISGKEGAKDTPSWARGERPYVDENGNDFADRLIKGKYGKGAGRGTHKDEYDKIRKYGDRNFK